MKEKKEKALGNLYIELTENMTKLINLYAEKAGINREDIGFAMGYISNQLDKSRDGRDQFGYLCQIYFFTGVLYAKEFKFKYEMLDDKAKELILKDMKAKEGFVEKPERPSYMG